MKRILTLIPVLLSLLVSAQERRFGKEIDAFKHADHVQPPAKDAIVFVGSSSFRMWKDLQEDFPGHLVINRGFGGSSLPHVIENADDIIFAYEPKQVVIYCGENDFMTDTVTTEIVAERFKTLFSLLRKQLPRAKITFVSMKPSPSRQRLMSEMAAANASIRDFLNKQRRTSYVNIWDPMLDEQGAPRPELFLKDMLHMNEKGYAIWQKALEPHLVK
jgi:lysophospholipase L1-like esterase